MKTRIDGKGCNTVPGSPELEVNAKTVLNGEVVINGSITLNQERCEKFAKEYTPPVLIERKIEVIENKNNYLLNSDKVLGLIVENNRLNCKVYVSKPTSIKEEVFIKRHPTKSKKDVFIGSDFEIEGNRVEVLLEKPGSYLRLVPNSSLEEWLIVGEKDCKFVTAKVAAAITVSAIAE